MSPLVWTSAMHFNFGLTAVQLSRKDMLGSFTAKSSKLLVLQSVSLCPSILIACTCIICSRQELSLVAYTTNRFWVRISPRFALPSLHEKLIRLFDPNVIRVKGKCRAYAVSMSRENGTRGSLPHYIEF